MEFVNNVDGLRLFYVQLYRNLLHIELLLNRVIKADLWKILMKIVKRLGSDSVLFLMLIHLFNFEILLSITFNVNFYQFS